MRITQPRIAILSALIEHNGPIPIDQLHGKLHKQSCDLVTVYRCLAAFEEIGLVRRNFQHNGTALYEITLGGQPRHYHIVCKGCGKVDNVDYFPVEGVERMLKDRGYTHLTHVVEFFGLCPTCQQQPTARHTTPYAPAKG